MILLATIVSHTGGCTIRTIEFDVLDCILVLSNLIVETTFYSTTEILLGGSFQ